jgi:hypothetical protein
MVDVHVGGSVVLAIIVHFTEMTLLIHMDGRIRIGSKVLIDVPTSDVKLVARVAECSPNAADGGFCITVELTDALTAGVFEWPEHCGTLVSD